MSTYYVDAINGSDYNDGLSPETAWATMTKAGNTMVDGDTVYVAPAVYRESIHFVNTGSFEVKGDPYCSVFTNSTPGFVRFTDTDETGYQYDIKSVWAPSESTIVLRNLFIDGNPFLFSGSGVTYELYNCTLLNLRNSGYSVYTNTTYRFYDCFLFGGEFPSNASVQLYRCILLLSATALLHTAFSAHDCIIVGTWGGTFYADSVIIYRSLLWYTNKLQKSITLNVYDSIIFDYPPTDAYLSRCCRITKTTSGTESNPVTPWSLGWTNPRAFLRGIAKALPFAQGYADFLDFAEEDVFGVDAVPSPFGTSLVPKSDAFPMEVGKTSLVDDQGKTRCIRIESMSVWHSRFVVSGQTTVSAEIWFNEVTDQDYKPVLGVINMSTGERYETVATDIPEKWQTLSVTFDAYQVSDVIVYVRSRYSSSTHYVLVSAVLIE